MLAPEAFLYFIPGFVEAVLESYASVSILVSERALTEPVRTDVTEALDRVAKIPPALGLPWPDSLWQRHGKPAVKAAGITKRVSYHTFRHTFGTLLNANGENPKVVQELLRHATLKVTTDTYLQALAPEKREAQTKLVRMVLGRRAMA